MQQYNRTAVLQQLVIKYPLDILGMFSHTTAFAFAFLSLFVALNNALIPPTLLLALGALLLPLAGALVPPTQDPFYTTPTNISAYEEGQLIRDRLHPIRSSQALQPPTRRAGFTSTCTGAATRSTGPLLTLPPSSRPRHGAPGQHQAALVRHRLRLAQPGLRA